jgi:putative proteasome-type protease
MTYAVGLLVNEGLVLAADTRTNAGFDNIATFKKLHTWSKPGERVFVLLTAGNLAVTQGVVSLLTEGAQALRKSAPASLFTVKTMFQAARVVGQAVREVRKVDGEALESNSESFSAGFILAGQIGEERPRLFQIYAAGNFIEATPDTPYFQIGEHKYGKPILDRAVRFDTDLYDALKISLISMDSTMRSNIGVGLPIDVTVIRRDRFEPEVVRRIEADEPYFHDLSERWSAALRAAHKGIPRPPYGPEAT